jgi:hypothetical protein
LVAGRGFGGKHIVPGEGGDGRCLARADAADDQNLQPFSPVEMIVKRTGFCGLVSGRGADSCLAISFSKMACKNLQIANYVLLIAT